MGGKRVKLSTYIPQVPTKSVVNVGGMGLLIFFKTTRNRNNRYNKIGA